MNLPTRARALAVKYGAVLEAHPQRANVWHFTKGKEAVSLVVENAKDWPKKLAECERAMVEQAKWKAVA